MIFSKSILLVFFLTASLAKAICQEMPPPVKNDSITLAQAYINLTLTKEYFEGIKEERIEKILLYEQTELRSITDGTFIIDNAVLYNFSNSLLYYNQTKFLFRTHKYIDRAQLIVWNKSLEKAINYFNISKAESSWEQENPFFELIKFEEESYAKLHQELFELKSLFTPYFNEDIYPDFKRLFLKAKNSDSFHIDSLSYFAGIYNLEYNTSIVEKKYDSYNYDYGPNTLPLVSEYDYSERDYDYYPSSRPIATSYLLDEKLDLISRYIQLKSLATKNNFTSLNWFESYRLYNDYYIFKDKSIDKLFINQITKVEDSFLKTELDSEELDALYAGLRENFSNAPYATAQAFINLSLVQGNFDSLSNSHITSVLSFNEIELREIKDTAFIAQNPELYSFTYSLLYENTARLLYRTRKNIDRKRLVEWKETLELGIDFYNLSQVDSKKPEANLEFDELIKFDRNDTDSQRGNINRLKDAFYPFFNEDIYPDFQRIFYKAKNGNIYDFEGLKSFTGIYNIRLDLSVLENQENRISQYTGEISKEYRILPKLDLISKYLQIIFLASDQYSIPAGFDMDQLYSSYNDFLNELDSEEDDFIRRELDDEAIELLFQQLQKKFPYEFRREDTDGDGIADSSETEPQVSRSIAGIDSFFFPEFAPLASASFIKRNFKPELKTLGKVDGFLRREFISAGYKDQLHYYYASDGFAITTSLERFTLDGSAVEADKRFE